MNKYWIGVASLSHVRLGVAGGFAQLGHGKEAPLKRMSAGDWIVYYSPKTDLDGGEPLRSFTAIGKLTDEAIYSHRMSKDLVPFRRDVRFVKSQPAPIAPLIAKLAFIKDKTRWGMPFRRGHIEVTKADFERIAAAMGARVDE